MKSMAYKRPNPTGKKPAEVPKLGGEGNEIEKRPVPVVPQIISREAARSMAYGIYFVVGLCRLR